jgi:hypothetical protein
MEFYDTERSYVDGLELIYSVGCHLFRTILLR